MKNLGRGLASAIFKLSILLLAIFAAFGAVFGKPDTLKTTLKDSGIYGNFADSLIQQAQEDTQASDTGQTEDIPVEDAAVQQAIKKSLTPEFAQSTSEQVIDGTYNWLNDKADKPTFNIDLSGVKQNLANNVGDVAVQRVEGLPACTIAQLQQLDPNNIDPFNLPCRPPGLNLQAERQKLVSQTLNNDDFLKDTSVSADDIKTEGQQGVNPFDKFAYIPKLFQFSLIAPVVFGILSLITGAGVILLDQDRRHGIKSAARTLLIVAVILLVSALISKFLLGQASADNLANIAATQQSVLYILRTLANIFSNVLLIFAVIYGLLGGGGLAALHFTKPAHPTEPIDTPKPKGPLKKSP